MSPIPEVNFDAVTEVVGAGSNAYSVYRPIVVTRMGVPTPVVITSNGYVAEGGGTVNAKFKAVDTVTYTNLRAQFVVIEQTGSTYPWTAREVATPAPISLSAPGDSVVVTRNFVVDWTPIGDLQCVVFLENTSGPFEIINAHLMPDPHAVAMAAPLFASEIDYSGTASYTATVTNAGTALDTVTVELSQDALPAGVGPTDWAASYREVGGSWQTAPAEYVLDPAEDLSFEVQLVDNIGTAEGMALTTLTATSGGNPSRSDSTSFATFVELPSILLFADDMGWGNESHWETALENNGYAARTWVAEDLGRPTLAMLQSYWAVLWTNANGNAFAFTGEDEGVLMDYLDGDGNLFLSSMNFLSSRLASTTFIEDYLHITSWTEDIGELYVYGVADDAISDSMELHLVYGPPPNSSDAFVATAPAEVIFTGTPGTQGVKIKEGDSKVVFTTFPFESVSFFEAHAPNNRDTYLARVLEWFGAGTGTVDGPAHRLALGNAYPNPFNPVTKIAYTVPDNAGRVTLTLHNVSGQLVRTLVDGELTAGPKVAEWDGRDEAGERLATGIYFARLSAGDSSAFTKMTLLK